MKRTAIQPLPKYFDRYINLVDDVDLDEAMERSLAELAHFDRAAYRQLGLQTYAPEKWTVPDVLQHLIDWERIMTYRALIFARQISKAAPGHDENLMAVHAQASSRSIDDLLDEMVVLRQTTRHFFKSLQEQQLMQSGICWESDMSALALGFTILGHQRHHFHILETRYLPLV